MHVDALIEEACALAVLFAGVMTIALSACGNKQLPERSDVSS